MKNRIGIVTLCSNNNFGNKLQNYALLKVLQNYEMEVYTIWIVNSYRANFVKQFLKALKKSFDDYFNNRNKKFLSFNRYLNLYHKKIIYNDDFLKVSRDFDYLVVGSDQVWNPGYIGNTSIYLLDGIQKEKKISYAASIGVDVLDKKTELLYKRCISDFKNISVREDRAKNILSEVIGRDDIECVLDPTLLLSRDEWEKVEKPIRALGGKKFVLMYFLGVISEGRKRDIISYAQKNDCIIIDVMDRESDFYEIGPEQFLWLIDKADLITTDSFHACVFSTIFQKRFVSFEREYSGLPMNSRMITLAEKLGFNFCYQKGLKLDGINYDYVSIRKKLNRERAKSFKYIEKALSQYE